MATHSDDFADHLNHELEVQLDKRAEHYEPSHTRRQRIPVMPLVERIAVASTQRTAQDLLAERREPCPPHFQSDYLAPRFTEGDPEAIALVNTRRKREPRTTYRQWLAGES